MEGRRVSIATPPMRPISFKSALVSVETCRAMLGQSEDVIVALVEEGKLRFAFNLAVNSRSRRLLRVLSLSLLDQAGGTDTQPAALEAAIRYILPGSSPELHASWLARKLNVSPTHVYRMIDTRCIQDASPRTRKVTGDRSTTRASVVQFLKDRRCA